MKTIKSLLFYICIFLLSGCLFSNPQNNSSHQVMRLPQMLAAVSSQLSATLYVYDSNQSEVLQQSLTFSEDENGQTVVNSPKFSLKKSTTYSFLIVFWWDSTLPLAFSYLEATVADDNQTSINFDSTTLRDSSVAVTQSLSEGTKESDFIGYFQTQQNISLSLDDDQDGYSNLSEVRGGSDPLEISSIPVGPVLKNQEMTQSADGDTLTITATFYDANGINDSTVVFKDHPYLSDITTEELQGTNGDKERTLTATLNPQYFFADEQILLLEATNALGVTTQTESSFSVFRNGKDPGPIIKIFNLSEGDVLAGDVELKVQAYDRHGISEVTLKKPSDFNDQNDDDDIYETLLQTGDYNDGSLVIEAQATNALGVTVSQEKNITISNGTDVSAPSIRLDTITDANGKTQNSQQLQGVVDLEWRARDRSGVSALQLVDGGTHFVASGEKNSANSYTNTIDTTLYTDGQELLFKFTATDLLGNTHTTPQEFRLKVNNTPFIHAFTADDQSEILLLKQQQLVTLSWQQSGATSVEIVTPKNKTAYQNGTPKKNETHNLTITESGRYTLRATYKSFNSFGEKVSYTQEQSVIISIDHDQDGAGEHEDCDETDTTINPTAAEVCDGIDNNCDGLIDEADPLLANAFIFYADNDKDGYGNPFEFILKCQDEVPSGYVNNEEDCDDESTAVNPSIPEVCDNQIDDDCNGQVDRSPGLICLSSVGHATKGFVMEEKSQDIFYYYYGKGVACADFNNDGQDEIIISSPYVREFNSETDSYNFGQTTIHQNPTEDALITYQNLDVSRNEDVFGYTVFRLFTEGDFNGDDYPDLIMFSDHYSLENLSAYSHFKFGGADFLDEPSAPQDVFTSLHYWDTNIENEPDIGAEAFAAGDINGDGYDDLVLGFPYLQTTVDDVSLTGLITIIYGGETSMTDVTSPLQTNTNIAKIYGDSTTLGKEIALADVNCDGFDDIITYRSTDKPDSEENTIYIFFGGTEKDTNGEVVNRFVGENTLANLSSRTYVTFTQKPGLSLSGVLGDAIKNLGNIDGDFVTRNGQDHACEDVVISMPSDKLFILHGDPNLNTTYVNNPENFTVFTSDRYYEKIGAAVEGQMDINNDGYSDFLFGQSDVRNLATQVRLVYGSKNLSNTLLTDIGKVGSAAKIEGVVFGQNHYSTLKFTACDDYVIISNPYRLNSRGDGYGIVYVIDRRDIY